MKFLKDAEITLQRCQDYNNLLVINGLPEFEELEGSEKIYTLLHYVSYIAKHNPNLFVQYAKICYQPTWLFPFYALWCRFRRLWYRFMFKVTNSGLYLVDENSDPIYGLLKSSEVASAVARFRGRQFDVYNTAELWSEKRGLKKPKSKKKDDKHYAQISYLGLASMMEEKGYAFKKVFGIKVPIPSMDCLLKDALDVASYEQDIIASTETKE